MDSAPHDQQAFASPNGDVADHLDIGGRAVDHLRTMYPAALKAVPKSAATSLRNFINNLVRAAVAGRGE